ncbi:MAG: endonuclease/exonuclease/phosphatase family protein, partial [Fimbriimonadaceae bacterium]
VGVGNGMWAKRGTERGEVVRRRLGEQGFDVICVTEGYAGVLPAGGHVIESDADYGYPIREGRRKVLLWSRQPWRAVDAVGDRGMPGGRFVSGVTETGAGALRVVGVCVPWDWAHVKTGRRDRRRWEDHLRYLEGLERYLAGLGERERAVVAGDFNQAVPRRRAPVRVYDSGSCRSGPRLETVGAGPRP